MQTVRASFTVPGKDGIAAAVQNDPFQPDEERMARKLRPIQYVDKSALILKENYEQANDITRSLPDIESEARVQEVKDPAVNTAAILQDAKHESTSNIFYTTTTTTTSAAISSEKPALPVLQARQAAKYAKLVGEHSAPVVDLTHKTDRLHTALTTAYSNYDELVLYFVSNLGTMLLLLAITVIMVACGVFIALREFRRVNQLKHNQKHQHQHHTQQQQQRGRPRYYVLHCN